MMGHPDSRPRRRLVDRRSYSRVMMWFLLGGCFGTPLLIAFFTFVVWCPL